MLVMVTNDGKHQAQRLQRLADGLAGDWVFFHDLPFFRTEIGALLEDLVRHGDLPQVVEESAPLQGNKRGFVQPKMAPEFAGVPRQSFAVAFRVRITSLDAESQRA